MMITSAQHKTSLGARVMVLSSADPTRTLGLRNRFAAEMERRFKQVRRAGIEAMLADQFHLRVPTGPTVQADLIPPAAIDGGRYTYRWSRDKAEEFMAWLEDQTNRKVLEMIPRVDYLGGRSEVPWTNTFIDSAYQSGIRAGRAELRAAGEQIPDFGDLGPGIGRDPAMMAFNQPFHADRVGLIYSRVFTDLKGVTSAMNTQMSRVLALGMAEGRNPREIARMLADRIDKIGIVRARLIARTEVLRSHNEAKLNEFERVEGMTGDQVKVKWVTALDERVRPKHRAWHGKIYTREEARGMIGEPNCRCTLVPYIPAMEAGIKEIAAERKARKKQPEVELVGLDKILKAGKMPDRVTLARGIDEEMERRFKSKIPGFSSKTVVSFDKDYGMMKTQIESFKDGKYIGSGRFFLHSKTDIFIDDVFTEKQFSGLGLGKAKVQIAEKIAKNYGATVASLDAEDQGRYIWGKMGYKVSSPKTMVQIQEFAKSKGILIRDESEFHKLAKWFDANAEGLPSSFSMTKDLTKIKFESEVAKLKFTRNRLPVEHVGKVGDTFNKMVTDVLDKVPTEINQKVFDAGWKIKLGEKVSVVEPSLKGVHPRGWPAGSTWDSAPGCARGSNKEILMAETYRPIGKKDFRLSPDVSPMTAHEYGHAIDQVMEISKKEGFIKAWRLDLKQMGETSKRRFSYLTKNRNAAAARDETAAEGFASLIGHSNYDINEFSYAFKNTLVYLKGELAI